MIKYFRFSWHDVVWEISYANLMMLSATVPEYKSKSGKSEENPDQKEAEGPQDLAKFLGL